MSSIPAEIDYISKTLSFFDRYEISYVMLYASYISLVIISSTVRFEFNFFLKRTQKNKVVFGYGYVFDLMSF